METELFFTIQKSINPRQEIINLLNEKKIHAADAVNTGELSNIEIHLYVAYCIKQITTWWRLYGDNVVEGCLKDFANPVLQLAYDVKFDLIMGRGNKKRFEQIEQWLSLLTEKWEGSLLHDVFLSLSGCLSLDPYEAHAFTVIYVPFTDPDKQQEVQQMMLQERRDFMLDLLVNKRGDIVVKYTSPITEVYLDQGVSTLFKLSRFKEVSQKRKAKSEW